MADADFSRQRISATVRRGDVASDECEVQWSHGDSAMTTEDEWKHWLDGAVFTPYPTTKMTDEAMRYRLYVTTNDDG